LGHTVSSARQVIDRHLAELSAFRKALRTEDREAFDRVMAEPLRHYGSITYTASIHVWAFILVACLLEQEKRIMALEHGQRRTASQREGDKSSASQPLQLERQLDEEIP